MLVIKQSGV
jgi:hypothetical protein